MLRKVVGLSIGLSLFAALTMADDKNLSAPGVEVVALSVSRKHDEKNFPLQHNSTTLTIKVSYPGKQLLGVHSSSTVKTFKDDKGTSLLKKTDDFMTSFNQFPVIGKDHTSMLVTVQSSVPPTTGATRLHLKGDLVVRCGLDEKTTEEKEIALKAKTEEKIGDFVFKVTQEKGFDGTGASFSLTTTNPGIKRVSVKGTDGKTIEVIPGASFSFKTSRTSSYTMKKPAERVKIAITYFAKEETATVPVDLTASVGLSCLDRAASEEISRSGGHRLSR